MFCSWQCQGICRRTSAGGSLMPDSSMLLAMLASSSSTVVFTLLLAFIRFASPIFFSSSLLKYTFNLNFYQHQGFLHANERVLDVPSKLNSVGRPIFSWYQPPWSGVHYPGRPRPSGMLLSDASTDQETGRLSVLAVKKGFQCIPLIILSRIQFLAISILRKYNIQQHAELKRLI